MGENALTGSCVTLMDIAWTRLTTVASVTPRATVKAVPFVITAGAPPDLAAMMANVRKAFALLNLGLLILECASTAADPAKNAWTENVLPVLSAHRKVIVLKA